MSPLRPISELASIIEAQSRTIEDGLKGTPGGELSLSFGAPPLLKLSPALEIARSEIIETIDELRARVLGPMGYLTTISWPIPGLLATLHTIYAFDIASHVPLSPGGEITYGELAERCGLPEDDTRRVVQTASTFRIFEEASPDLTVRHNAVSAVFASPGINAVLGLLLEENWPAAAKFVDSLKRFPGSGEPGHSAQMVALRAADAAAGNTTSRDEIEDTSKGLFDHISKDEKRVARFRTAMGVSHSTPGFSTLHFVNNLPWADKDQCPQTVIDVGGAGGELSELILRTYSGVKKAISLDLPEVVANLKVPEDLGGRLEYGSYNFLNEEMARQTDAYVFRHIFHDWSDKYAVKILKNLAPALKTGTRIWLNEVVLPELSDRNHTKDQLQRCADLLMKMGFNSKERSKRDWTNLLAAADPRFQIKSIVRPENAQAQVIEVVFGA